MYLIVQQRILICISLELFVDENNTGFAQHGTHLYVHDFAPLFGFLFVWRGIEKKQQNMLLLLIYFIARFETSTKCVF